MKKIFGLFALIFAFTVLAFTADAQRTITDTLQGNETVNFTSMYKAETVTATCTQLGGTSDGTLELYGSTDGTVWTPISFYNTELGVAAPYSSIPAADSIDRTSFTITNGLVCTWAINNDNYLYYRVTGVGTASDTTKIVITWSR